MIDAAPSESTKATRRHLMRELHDYLMGQGTATPATPDGTLLTHVSTISGAANFLSWMATRERKPRTHSGTDSMRAALAKLLQLHGLPNTLNHPLIKEMMEGIRKHAPPRKLQRRSATRDDLRRIRDQLDLSQYDDILLWSLLYLCFMVGLRPSEVSGNKHHIRRRDLTIANDDIRITLRTSKPDQAGVGERIKLLRTGEDDCYHALRSFIQRRDAVFGDSDGFVFLRLNRRPITYDHLVKRLKAVSTAAGLSNLHLQSFRKGFATGLVDGSEQPHIVKLGGRWRSDCWLVYPELTDATRRRIQDTLESSGVNPENL